MFDTHTNRVDDRIVSFFQPWVRPIKRGKQNAETEFWAKVEMGDINVFLRVEHLSWNRAIFHLSPCGRDLSAGGFLSFRVIVKVPLFRQIL